jgi:hypothetical protein
MKPVYTHDAIRASLNKKIRPDPRKTLNDDPSKGDRPPLESLRQTEWIPEFEQYMRNRLVMGACRYETFEEKMRYNKYACIDYVRRKLKEYEDTGNLECLVDGANLLMIEFGAPHHPNPHFTPGDDTSHVGTFK